MNPPAAAPPAFRVGAVVLAAGASRRLGRPKQLVRVSGETLLARTVDALLAVPAVWPVVVVVGAEAAAVRAAVARRPVLVAENAAWAEGVASSLRAGLLTLRQFSRHLDAALFALCDQPHFSSAAVERLLAAAGGGASVVAARYGGHPGAPAIIGRTHFEQLAQLTGDEGARKLFASLPLGAIRCVDLPELAEDVDTPEDLARLTAS